MDYDNTPVYRDMSLNDLRSAHKVLCHIYDDQLVEMEKVTDPHRLVQKEIYIHTLKFQIGMLERVIRELSEASEFYKIVDREFPERK